MRGVNRRIVLLLALVLLALIAFGWSSVGLKSIFLNRAQIVGSLSWGDVAFIRIFVWDSQTSDKQCSMVVKTNENGFARLQIFTLMHEYEFSETNNHWECTGKSVYFH